MARRRLRKRQGPSPLARKGPVQALIDGGLGAAEAARIVYEGLTKGRKITKAIKSAAKQLRPGTRDGRKMKKKMPEEVWTENSTNGIKFHSLSISYKATKASKLQSKLAAPGKLYGYVTAGASSNQGVQAATLLSSITSTQLTELFVALNNAVTPTANQASYKFQYKRVNQVIQFANAGPTTCEFEIYVLIDKVTLAVPSNPVTIWNAAVPGEANDTAAPVESAADLWTKPTDYKLFNINYWSKRVRCFLTPGEKCELTINFSPNRIMDTQYMNAYQSVRGLTFHVLIVQRGSLGDGTQTLAVTPGEQTITPSKLIWMYKRTIHGSLLAVRPRVTKQVGGELPSTVGALWSIDEDTGEPENAMVAAEYA